MVARSVARFGSSEWSEPKSCRRSSAARCGCVWATPSPRVVPTSRLVRPVRCATATAGSSTDRRCSPPARTTASTSSSSPTPIPTLRSTRASPCFWCRSILPGIEIQGIRTVDGDRTNIVYYSDVRVDDKYRLGEVNGGWTVLREPLNAEHGAVAAAPDGLQDVSIMMHQAGFMATRVDKAAATVGRARIPTGAGSIDDESVAIGWVAAPPGSRRRCLRRASSAGWPSRRRCARSHRS